MKITQIVFYLSLITFIFACSKNAVKEFEKGNSLKAYEILLKKAKKGEITRDEKKLFKEVILDLVHSDSLKMHRNIHSNVLEDKMEGYAQLKDIKKRHQELIALRYPLPSYDYYSSALYDSVSYDVTADLYTRAGDRLQRTIDEGNKIHARNAYTDIERIDDYHLSESYPLDELKRNCLYHGTVHTLVQFDNDVRFGSRYIDRYFDDDEIRLSESRWNKFYFRNDLDMSFDRIAEVILTDADFDDDTNRSSKKYSERVITSYETKTDTSGTTEQVPVYGTVSATVTTERITRELLVRGYVNVQERGQNDDRDNIRENYKESIEVYSFTGDERALPNSIKNKLDKPRENFSREENFYREALEDFMDEAERKLERLD